MIEQRINSRNNFSDERESEQPSFDRQNASSPHKHKPISEIYPLDDLIRTLANAYENKRARQVIEWELHQRGYHHQSV